MSHYIGKPTGAPYVVDLFSIAITFHLKLAFWARWKILVPYIYYLLWGCLCGVLSTQSPSSSFLLHAVIFCELWWHVILLIKSLESQAVAHLVMLLMENLLIWVLDLLQWANQAKNTYVTKVRTTGCIPNRIVRFIW